MILCSRRKTTFCGQPRHASEGFAKVVNLVSKYVHRLKKRREYYCRKNTQIYPNVIVLFGLVVFTHLHERKEGKLNRKWEGRRRGREGNQRNKRNGERPTVRYKKWTRQEDRIITLIYLSLNCNKGCSLVYTLNISYFMKCKQSRERISNIQEKKTSEENIKT